MQLKDYYSILELQPSASGDDVKKAYRRLVHLYHPDKKHNDQYAAARFAEIKEAYETLINPAKKEYYLQQRWYAQSTGRKIKRDLLSPVSVLKEMLELERFASKQDAHRTYHEGLYNQICQLLSDENITMLHTFNEADTNREIIRHALKSGHSLPYRFVPLLCERLKKLAADQPAANGLIDQFARDHQRMNYWEKHKVWIVLLIVLLICFTIFLSAN